MQKNTPSLFVLFKYFIGHIQEMHVAPASIADGQVSKGVLNKSSIIAFTWRHGGGIIIVLTSILVGYFWCMGGSSSTNMAKPCVVSATAKHTASVSIMFCFGFFFFTYPHYIINMKSSIEWIHTWQMSMPLNLSILITYMSTVWSLSSGSVSNDNSMFTHTQSQCTHIMVVHLCSISP